MSKGKLAQILDSIWYKSLKNETPTDGRFYFGINSFDSGWRFARKGFWQFIGWLILSPFIALGWILSKLFGQKTPPDFGVSYPPTRGGNERYDLAYDELIIKQRLPIRSKKTFQKFCEMFPDELPDPALFAYHQPRFISAMLYRKRQRGVKG